MASRIVWGQECEAEEAAHHLASRGEGGRGKEGKGEREKGRERDQIMSGL